MARADALARVALFRGLDPGQYQALSAIAQELSFARGQAIFAEGEEGRGFYVILSGRVKVYKLSAEGKEQILHVLGPGEPFAEAAVLAGSRFPAHAVALEASHTLYFPRREFTALIQKNPTLAMNMMAALSLRLKEFARLIESLSLKEVPARLAVHLLLLAEEQDQESIRLDLTKTHLASLLGTIPETLSRILARMTKLGLIACQGPTITLLDRDALEAVAAGEERL